ncbi:sigma-54 dependent transcriptional regulator [Parasalinivibrio latis]|uniref:sigma-54-dependent transcriptional regulator n=1 Tax=Parasalinivibrio latis TaxID=2952610 RepID=UPI0030E3B32B
MSEQTRGDVLLVEDDAIVRQATAQWLELAGFNVTSCETGFAAMDALAPDFSGIVISDVKLGDHDGVLLLQDMQQVIPDLPVILITGHGDIDMAVKALRLGAFDFIEKPFDPQRLTETVVNALAVRRQSEDQTERHHYLSQLEGLEKQLIGQSPAIRRLRDQLLKVAEMDTNVIIYGETGSGKELVAQSLHRYSSRNNAEFVAINCAAIPENLFESELFGHEAGAFTGAAKRRIGKLEYADKGSVFLDEIESMPVSMQIKVLRSLQEHTIERVGANQTVEIDIRCIAAAKEDLKDHAYFRQDLFYRLNVSQLYIPPLRERGEDILLLFDHFVQQQNPERSASTNDQETLLSYHWPGNVRELRNIATRFALENNVSVGEILASGPDSIASPTQRRLPLTIQLQNVERQILQEALTRHKGHIQAVMEELDLPRRTLNQKMQKHGLNRNDYT